MKAIGATSWHIFGIYTFIVFVYGLLALIIAVPLGTLGSTGITNFFLIRFGVEPIPLIFHPSAIRAQIIVALLMPLLASLIPIIAGLRITVREAISTYGLVGAVGLVQKLIAQTKHIPHLVLLIIGNTFRNNRRVIITLLTLIGSGLIFMMVMSVRDSAIYTFSEEVAAIHKFHVTLQFEDPERINQIERLVLTQPGVKAVEMWSVDPSKIRPASQLEASDDDRNLLLFGVPANTAMYAPHLQAGRWLQPDDTQAMVLNDRVAQKLGLSVGDWVTVDHGLERESDWHVVGLMSDPVGGGAAHVPYTTLSRKLGCVNKANTIWIKTEPTDPASTFAIAQNLRSFFESRNINVATDSVFQEYTITDITADVAMAFNIIIGLLTIMALVIAVIGSVGLSGMLSLSVLERRREIGVMRAIGASSGHMARIFIGEGLLLGLLSWLIALPLSIPAAYGFVGALSSTLDVTLLGQYTPTGALYWLVIITVLSVLASWFPARNATRISVRESLAYQ
jgi:putative ABC transport system permease protein